jgi:hypothetical protein
MADGSVVDAATMTAIGAITAAVVTFLMNLKLNQRVEEHARAMLERESTLRLQSEVRLRLHEKSWSLLREAVTALYECHKTLHDSAYAVAHNSTEREQARRSALQAVVKVEALATTAPPEAGLSEMREKLKLAMRVIVVGPKSSEEAPTAFLTEASRNVGEAFDLGKQAMARWNEQLWTDAPKVAKPEARSSD